MIKKLCVSNYDKLSSNVNAAIRAVLKVFILFTKIFYTHKKYKKHKDATKQKYKKHKKPKNVTSE